MSNDQAQTEKIGFCDTVILIKDKSYLKSYFCTKTESCKYSSRNIKDLRKHEKTCSSETNYKYREKSFGNPKNIFQELIDLKVLTPDTEIYEFCTFDIETLLNDDSFQFR